MAKTSVASRAVHGIVLGTPFTRLSDEQIAWLWEQFTRNRDLSQFVRLLKRRRKPKNETESRLIRLYRQMKKRRLLTV